MISAKKDSTLFSSILTLAASHISLIYSQDRRNDLGSAIRYRQDAENGLAKVKSPFNHASAALLMLGNFFASSPHQWKALLLHQTRSLSTCQYLGPVLAQDLDDSACRLYLRIGKPGSTT